MHIRSTETKPRRVDASLEIFPHFTLDTFAFDVAEGHLDGVHGMFLNHVSDKAYFVLDGSGTIYVDGKEFEAAKGSIVAVPKGALHGLTGKMRFLVMTSPSFDPENEELLEWPT